MGFAAGDTNLRRYVGNNVTNLLDPSGLAADPLFKDDPAGGWTVKKGYQDKMKVTGGTLYWKFEEKAPYKSLRAEFWFEPDKTNPSKKIGFVQVVHESTFTNKGKVTPFWAGDYRLEGYFKKFTTKPNLANQPDIIPIELGGTSLYYDADTLGSGGPKPVTAYMSDIVGTAIINKDKMTVPMAREGHGDITIKFETAVVTQDSREVLASISWGFKIADKVGSPIEMLGGKKADVKKSVSADFSALIKQANTVKGIKYTTQGPDTKTIKVGGTSILTGK